MDTLLSVPRGTILRLEPMQWHSPQTQVPHIGARGVATMNWVAPSSLGAATPRYTFTCRSTVGSNRQHPFLHAPSPADCRTLRRTLVSEVFDS